MARSGKEPTLLLPPPLRTGRELFRSSGPRRCQALREQSRCSRRYNPGFPPMNAKPFEERTVFNILTPARIERIGRAFDLRMSPYLGFACTAQFHPKDLTARRFRSGINRKHPT